MDDGNPYRAPQHYPEQRWAVWPVVAFPGSGILLVMGSVQLGGGLMEQSIPQILYGAIFVPLGLMLAAYAFFARRKDSV